MAQNTHATGEIDLPGLDNGPGSIEPGIIEKSMKSAPPDERRERTGPGQLAFAHHPQASLMSDGHQAGHGASNQAPGRFTGTFQISRAYSEIVRSEENQPTVAVLIIADLVQAFLSAQARATLRCDA